jgi:hypothetical protein
MYLSGGGGTWTPVIFETSLGVVLSNLFVTCLAISPNYAYDATLFVGTDAGGVFMSTDGSVTWAALPGLPVSSPPAVTCLAISPNYANDQTLFAGTADGVYMFTTGDTGWSPVGSPITGVSCLAICPIMIAGATGYTVFAGTDDGLRMFTTGDTGWTPNLLPTVLAVSCLAISPNYANATDPDHTIFAGTARGVYMSTDGGTGWNTVNNSLPALTVSCLTVSPDYNNNATAPVGTVFVGIEGQGVSKSTNVFSSTSTSGTYMWIASNTGVTNLAVSCLAISPNYANTSEDQLLLLGTDEGGVFMGAVVWEWLEDLGIGYSIQSFGYALMKLGAGVGFIPAQINVGAIRVFSGHVTVRDWRATVYGSAMPTTGCWQVGDKIINTAPAGGGGEGWICVTAGGAYSGNWVPGSYYNVGTCVLNNGVVYQCMQAGTSAASGPGPSGSTVSPNPKSAGTLNIQDGAVTGHGVYGIPVGPCIWNAIANTQAVFKTFGSISS